MKPRYRIVRNRISPEVGDYCIVCGVLCQIKFQYLAGNLYLFEVHTLSHRFRIMVNSQLQIISNIYYQHIFDTKKETFLLIKK